jgi:hypothetical protein
MPSYSLGRAIGYNRPSFFAQQGNTMDISTDEYRSDGNRSYPFLTVLRSIASLLKRLTGLFVLSEEDQEKAGIFLGGEGRD